MSIDEQQRPLAPSEAPEQAEHAPEGPSGLDGYSLDTLTALLDG